MIKNTEEPVTFTGDGEYNLDVLTEIKAADSFLEIDQDVRDCQNVETFYGCTSRHYMDNIIRDCGCLPINLKSKEKVQYIINH